MDQLFKNLLLNVL